MGIDLLHEKRPYMYFTADSKIASISEDFYYFELLNEQKEFLYRFKNLDTKNLISDHRTKADSMKQYASQMIRAANYVIKNKLYWTYNDFTHLNPKMLSFCSLFLYYLLIKTAGY